MMTEKGVLRLFVTDAILRLLDSCREIPSGNRTVTSDSGLITAASP